MDSSFRNGSILLGIIISSLHAFTLGHLKGLGIVEDPSYLQSMSFVFNVVLSRAFLVYENLGINLWFLEAFALVVGALGWLFLRKFRVFSLEHAILTVAGSAFVLSLVLGWRVFVLLWSISFPMILAITVYQLSKIISFKNYLAISISFVSRLFIMAVLLAFSWVYPYGYAKLHALDNAELYTGKKISDLGAEESLLIWRGAKGTYWYKCSHGKMLLISKFDSNQMHKTPSIPINSHIQYCDVPKQVFQLLSGQIDSS